MEEVKQKKPTGPKPKDGVRGGTRHQVTLDTESSKKLADYGNGSLSAGIRMASKLVPERGE